MPNQRAISRAAKTLARNLRAFDLIVELEDCRRIVKSEVDRISVGGRASRATIKCVDLTVLAGDIASALAAERPGADLLDQPSDSDIDLALATRVLAGLAEAAAVRIRAGTDMLPAYSTLDLTNTMSLLAQAVTKSVSGNMRVEFVPVHSAILARAARHLEAAASVLDDTDLQYERLAATAFRMDADSLRRGIGLPPGTADPH